MIEGFSESTWKSLVVKSLRIGWVEGLEVASEVLAPSAVKNLLVCGIFEDLFPGSTNELEEQYQAILDKDYLKLCQYETHHGRGYSDQFCDLEKEAVKNGRNDYHKIFFGVIKPNTTLTWINPRVANCLYTWDKIQPKDEGVKREPLFMEFKGMPDCIMDGHTFEGKRTGKDCLLLSGHYHNHRAIGKEVSKNGWGRIREKFGQDEAYELQLKPKQAELF